MSTASANTSADNEAPQPVMTERIKLYKITDRHCRDVDGILWGEGIEHTAPGEGELYGPGWLCAHTDLLLALFTENALTGFFWFKVWEAEGIVGRRHPLQVGCTWLKTIREIPGCQWPRITDAQRIRFAILCAKAVCRDKPWNVWADDWLSGKNRDCERAYDEACELKHVCLGLGDMKEITKQGLYAAHDAAWAADRDSPHVVRASAWAAVNAAMSPLSEGVDFAALARRAVEEEA